MQPRLFASLLVGLSLLVLYYGFTADAYVSNQPYPLSESILYELDSYFEYTVAVYGNGSIIAFAVWRPGDSQSQVLVYEVGEGYLYSLLIDGLVTDMAWTSDMLLVVVNGVPGYYNPDSAEVYGFDFGGNEVLHESFNDGVYYVEYVESRDEVVLVSDEAVYFYSAAGFEWDREFAATSHEYYALRASWSPDWNLVAVASSEYLTFYDSYGNYIKEEWLGVGYIFDVAWMPSEALVAVAASGGLFLYDYRAGTVYNVDTCCSFYSVDWLEGDGMLVAMGSGRVGVYSVGRDRAVLVAKYSFTGSIEGGDLDAAPNAYVVGLAYPYSSSGYNKAMVFNIPPIGVVRLDDFEGGDVTVIGMTQTTLSYDSGDAYIILTQGSYVIKHKVKTSYPYIGKPEGRIVSVAVSITRGEFESHRLQTADEVLGRIHVTGAPGLNVTFDWTAGKKSFLIGSSGEFTVYAEPGYYSVSWILTSDDYTVGDLEETSGGKVIQAKASKVNELNLPSTGDLVGWLKIVGQPGSSILVRWQTGVARYTLSDTSLTLKAVPGSYTITYEVPEPMNYVGPEAGLTGRLTKIVSKGGQTVAELPKYDSMLARLHIMGPADSSVTVTVSNYSDTFIIPSTGYLDVWIIQGDYQVSYDLAQPENYLGSFRALSGVIEGQAFVGETYDIELPSYSEILALIHLSVPPDTNVVLLGEADRLELSTSSSPKTFDIWAEPGSISITAMLSKPANYIGPESGLQYKDTITITAGNEYHPSIPARDEILAQLTVTGYPGTTIVFEWTSDRKAFTLGETGSIIVWAAPGRYAIRAGYVPPSNYIGPVDGVKWHGSIEASAGDEQTLNLPSYDEVLALVRIEAHIPAVLSWLDARGNHYEVSVEEGEAVYYVAPGEYTVSFKLPRPESYVGPEEGLIIKKTLHLSAGGQERLVIPSPGEYLVETVFRGPPNARLEVRYGPDVWVRDELGDEVRILLSPTVDYDVVVEYGDLWRGGELSYHLSPEPGSPIEITVKREDYPWTPIFYATIISAVAATLAAAWAFNETFIKPNPVIKKIEGLSYEGVYTLLNVTIGNRGARPWTGKLTIYYSGEVSIELDKEISGRSTETIHLVVYPDGSYEILDRGGGSSGEEG